MEKSNNLRMLNDAMFLMRTVHPDNKNIRPSSSTPDVVFTNVDCTFRDHKDECRSFCVNCYDYLAFEVWTCCCGMFIFSCFY
jgi:hypothetical protein